MHSFIRTKNAACVSAMVICLMAFAAIRDGFAADAVATTFPPLIQGANIGANNGAGQSVAVDSSGNRYVIGFFSGTSVDFNLAAGAQDLKSAVGSSDVFITKFDSTGAYVWTQVFGGSGDDRGYGVAVSPDGTKVYATGQLQSTNAGFGGVAGSFTSVNGGTFVLALNASTGAPITGFGTNGVQQFGGSGDSLGIAVAASSSIVYVAGNFSAAAKIGNTGTAISTVGGQDAYVIALDFSSGAAISTFGLSLTGIQKIGGTGTENVSGLALTPDASTLYVSGTFTSANLGIGASGSIASAGGNDGYVAVISTSNGAANTAFNGTGFATFGGAGDDQIFGITATNSNVYFTGYYSGTGAKLNGTGTSFNALNSTN